MLYAIPDVVMVMHAAQQYCFLQKVRSPAPRLPVFCFQELINSDSTGYSLMALRTSRHVCLQYI